MRARALWLLKRTAALLAVGLLTFLAIRVWDSQRGLPLEPWHTFVPEELTAAASSYSSSPPSSRSAPSALWARAASCSWAAGWCSRAAATSAPWWPASPA